MSEGPSTLSIGHILEGRYRIVSDGTAQDIGTEYKAYDLYQERLAVVILLARRLGGVGALENVAAANQAVADLTLPSLIPYDHVGQVYGQIYVARSHVEGQTLADLLARTGPLEVGAAVELTIRLCQALAAAHRAGVVHGSLSPHCVLVADSGEVLVADTGLLPSLRAASATTGQPWGRFPYLSPEQAAGEGVHPATDVYVAGSLLYTMLAGRPPFVAGDPLALVVQHLRQEPPSLLALSPHVPLPLAQIVYKALAKEPAARYRNAAQLAYILSSQGRPESATPPTLPVPTYQAPLVVDQVRQPLMVPPPPATAYPARERYGAYPEARTRDEEREGVDWLLVFLAILALIAILGLIPLWRTVYRRYAAPSEPASYGWLDWEVARWEAARGMARSEWQGTPGEAVSPSFIERDGPAPAEGPALALAGECGLCRSVRQGLKLGPLRQVGYNIMLEAEFLARVAPARRQVASSWVWESSLRAGDGDCSKLWRLRGEPNV